MASMVAFFARRVLVVEATISGEWMGGGTVGGCKPWRPLMPSRISP